MSIIKVISDDGVKKIITLDCNEISIDIENCKDIIFYNFLKENVNFTSLDNVMSLSLQNGVTVHLENIDVRFSKYKSVTLNFNESDSTEASFLIGTKVLLKYCLSKFFTYKNNFLTLDSN